MPKTTNEILADVYGTSYINGLPNADNCSGFIKSLGKEIGISIPEKQADGIIADLNLLTQDGNYVSAWEKLGTGTETIQQAVKYSGQGKLVIAAITSKDSGPTATNGHLSIVLPKLGEKNAPLMYGGGRGLASSKGDKTIRQVFNPSKHDKLQFFVHRTVFLGVYE